MIATKGSTLVFDAGAVAAIRGYRAETETDAEQETITEQEGNTDNIENIENDEQAERKSGIRTGDTGEKTSHEQVFIPEKKPVYHFFKRAFDIVSSFCGIVVLSPVFLAVAVYIMICDFGNPFYTQKRIGKNGKPFNIVKFRTMYKDADKRKAELLSQNESDGIHFKMHDDPRIFKGGKVIRACSLDELPQLFNVLIGDMSVVGPRPFVASEQEQLPTDRLFVKPGITCFWQITFTENMPIEEQLELDYKYIRERSFLLDLKLIFLTLASVVRRKNS